MEELAGAVQCLSDNWQACHGAQPRTRNTTICNRSFGASFRPGARGTGLFGGLAVQAHHEGGHESHYRPEERIGQRGSQEAIQIVPQVQSCRSSFTKT